MTTLLLALLAIPCWGARRLAVPDPSDLLRQSLEPSTSSYEGLLRVESGVQGREKVKMVRLRVQAPGRYRREILDAAGQPTQLVVSDGIREWIYDERRHKAWEGERLDPDVKQLGPEDELELLAANYILSVSTSEPVAGRPCWRLELRARADAMLRRRLWLDRRTGLTLAAESFGPDGARATAMRFERISFPGRQAKALFKFTPPPGAAVVKRLDPDYLALDEAKSASGMEARTPAWLPAGYVFESLDVLPRGGRKIIHYRFSDGVDVLSLFQCPPGVMLDFGAKSAKAVPLSRGKGLLAWTTEGEALSWSAGRTRFLLVGPVSEQTLRRIADSVR